ncbi:MAG: pertactin-like passenger domain-containing protein [Acidaminococcaceae bacterium]|nr:pertactin-like passenger domain-containing protein [Acidaminococcaceae bacterium]
MKKRAQKLQAQSILATVVMGMNLVNATAPAAALAAAEQPEPLPQQAVGEARPEDLQVCAYEVLPILAGYVDDLVFSKAEAQDYSVGIGQPIHYTKTDDSDKVYVYSGGTCSIDSNHAGGSVYEGGSLNVGINVGATPLVVFGGNVSITDYRMGDLTVSGGTVNISNNSNNHSVYGGTCTVALNSAGAQQTIYGGTGIITEMEANTGSDQYQDISGGTGIIGSMTLNQHHQNITAGYGEVVTMSGGAQTIYGGAEGHIQEMHGGTQNVYQALAKGTIGTMYNGASQDGAEGSIVEIGTMSGGKQTVAGTGKIETMVSGNQTVGLWVAGSSAVGTIQQMSNGMQIIYSGHTGIIESMDGGYQYAGYNNSSAGNGMIKVMNSGQQQVYNDGSGTILKMVGSGASQIIGRSGTAATGSIVVMEAGKQAIGYQNGNFGKGSITLMNDGLQIIGYVGGSGIGTITTMNGGSQIINNAGAGTVTALLGGEQIVSSGGKAVDTTIAGGTQDIRSGGIAVSTTIKAGQQIVSVGAIVSGAVLSGGVQQVYDGTNLHDITFEGGTQAVMEGATVSGMQVDSGMQAVQSGGNAADTTVGSSGLQYIEAGAVISGTVLDGGVLRLAQADRDYTISDTLTINNGVLDLTDGAGLKRNLRAAPVYQKLTMSDLQGSGGSIYMDTDLVNNDGDKITVQNSNTGTGTYGIYVNDRNIITDTELTGHLLLVDDQSKKLNFKGMTVNNGGLWDTDADFK